MVTIDIRDIGTSSTYTLSGSTLRMVESGGCRDALRNIKINESYSLDYIERIVYKAWIAGYDGDPKENDLTVTAASA